MKSLNCKQMKNVLTPLINFLLLLYVLNILVFRKNFIGFSSITDILIGSLPNLIAVIIVSYSCLLSYKILHKYDKLFILGITCLLILEEFFPTLSGNKIFDIYDILFSITGGIITYLLLKFKVLKLDSFSTNVKKL